MTALWITLAISFGLYTISNSHFNEQIDDYVDYLFTCYDVDDNGSINKTEMVVLIKYTLWQWPCPTRHNQIAPNCTMNNTIAPHKHHQ